MKLRNKEIIFKPVFGNVQHIRIGQLYGTLENTRKELEIKLKAQKESKALRETIKQTENQIVAMLKANKGTWTIKKQN